MQFWPDRSPQGYQWRLHGTAPREIADFEGILLARKPNRPDAPKGGKTGKAQRPAPGCAADAVAHPDHSACVRH